MRTWMPVWLFPVGVVGALVLLTLNSPISDLLALLWAFVLILHGAALVLRRSPGGAEHFRDLETDYWRTDGWRAGPR